MVRDGRVLTGGDDGLERRVGRTQSAHPLVEVEPDLTFGPARPDAVLLDQLGQRPVGHGARRAQRVDLAWVLDRSQLLHQVLGGDEFDIRSGRLLLSMRRDGDRQRLETDLVRKPLASSARSQGRSILRGRSGTSAADCTSYRPSVQNTDASSPSTRISKAAFDPVNPVR